MPIDSDTVHEAERIARLVDIAKHFPLSLDEWLQYHLDLQRDEVVPLYVADALEYAQALWDRAQQLVYEEVDGRRARREAVLNSLEAARRDET